MTDFDWVTARNRCSAGLVFEDLRLSVKIDVETRQGLRKQIENFGFEHSFLFSSKGNMFSASMQTAKLKRSVIFTLQGDLIVVTDENGTELLRASLTISNTKECRLVVAGEELEEWQFRKNALEPIFFGL